MVYKNGFLIIILSLHNSFTLKSCMLVHVRDLLIQAYVHPSMALSLCIEKNGGKRKARDIHLVNLVREVSQISRSYYLFISRAAYFITSFKIVNDKKIKVRGSFFSFLFCLH